jgi:hypothetical protein
VGKPIKYNFAFCAAGGCRGEGNLGLSFKFEIFYPGREVSLAHSLLTVAP